MKHVVPVSRKPRSASAEEVAVVGIIAGSVVSIVFGLSGKIWLDRNLPRIEEAADQWSPFN
jgi:hypothetical protein